MESGIVVAPNHILRAETTEPLANWRTCSNCREDGAHQILKETTAVPAELFAEEAAVNLLKGRQKTGPLQEVFFADCPETRMIWKHVCLPLRKYSASLSVRDNTQNVISPSRVQFGEVVCN